MTKDSDQEVEEHLERRLKGEASGDCFADFVHNLSHFPPEYDDEGRARVAQNFQGNLIQVVEDVQGRFTTNEIQVGVTVAKTQMRKRCVRNYVLLNQRSEIYKLCLVRLDVRKSGWKR